MVSKYNLLQHLQLVLVVYMTFWDMVITIVTEQLSKLLAPAGISSWLPAGVRAAYYATVCVASSQVF